MMRRIVYVLPTPGPPAITVTGLVSARSTAASCPSGVPDAGAVASRASSALRTASWSAKCRSR